MEKNLRAAVELYLDDVREHPETVVSPISIEEFVDFLRETEPDWHKYLPDDLLLKPREVHEVPSYAYGSVHEQ